MKTHYLKVLGQKMGDGKVALIMVVEEDTIMANLPTIFEIQAAILPKTIYTGTNPTIKLIPETLVNRDSDKGKGLAGLFVETGWFNKTVETPDPMGVSLES